MRVPQPPATSTMTEARRGEVNELKAVSARCAGRVASACVFTCARICVNSEAQLLRNKEVERTPARKREVIKKVIAYMTLGIDVSKLFSEIVLVRGWACLVVHVQHMR